MANIIKIQLSLVLAILLSNPLFSSNLIKMMDKDDSYNKTSSNQSTNGKYSVEETTELLRSRRLGRIQLDHDDHVYKCMEISQKAKNLEGALDILVESKLKLGHTLEYDEVDLIINISKLDTNLYQEIIVAAKEIGKKITSTEELLAISNELQKGNGKYLLLGIERASDCNFKIENDYFTRIILNLLVKVGKLEDENRFFDIYSSMRSIGMSWKIDSKGLDLIYKLYFVEGDVATRIAGYVKHKTKDQLKDKEYIMINGFFFYAKNKNSTEKGIASN